jgi:hypothetical protein
VVCLRGDSLGGLGGGLAAAPRAPRLEAGRVGVKQNGLPKEAVSAQAEKTANGKAACSYSGGLDVSDDVREDVTDRRAKQGQDDDNDDGHEDQDQGVFDEALTLVVFEGKHGEKSLSMDKASCK